MKTFLRGLLYCVIIAALFLVGLHAVSVGNGEVDKADAEDDSISFKNEDDLQAYIEDHYTLDKSDIADQFDYLYSDGWREGYDEGYRDGYQAGYEDGANGAEYWEP